MLSDHQIQILNYFNWKDSSTLESKSFICGNCGKDISSQKGYYADSPKHDFQRVKLFIYICHHCNQPTFFNCFNKQIPGFAYGENINDVPQTIELLYNEARNCMKVNAHTASVLCCRKLLMNIGVEKKAETNQSFKYYVDYLSEKGYIPPDGKEWVDHIRDKGNEANHEISIMTADDAIELINFIEMLLKFIYQFPAIIKKKKEK